MNHQDILTPELMKLLKTLHHHFEPRRKELLKAREERQRQYDAGAVPQYDKNSLAANSDWKVSPIPVELQCRRVEITGPVNSAKMVINMLGRNEFGERADMAMLDFEDSMKPVFSHVIEGYRNVIGAVRGDLTFVSEKKTYRLDPQDKAYVMVRVRGLHMNEHHVMIDGAPISAGLLDLAVCFHHTAKLYLSQNKTPKYYVPKCEHYLEARWWNDLFIEIQRAQNIPRGTLKATFLIETLPATFQIEEILYEIREHAAGLNVGRWDKIFSDIKVLRMHPDRIMPDRSTVNMERPWMENYAKRVIKICHERGAFAMGGMSAFTPGKTEETREQQAEKVFQDKQREADWGHDGCWVSHPYFIGFAKKAFIKKNQLDKKLDDFDRFPDLLPKALGPTTLAGLRTNIRVGIAYMYGWKKGLGCVSFEDLMEDLATLEISRAQTWQWIYHGIMLDNGQRVTRDLVLKIFEEERQRIINETRNEYDEENLKEAGREAAALFTQKELQEFLGHNHQKEESMDRWKGIVRTYSQEEVTKLKGTVTIEYSLAKQGADRLWQLLHERPYVHALGALTGNQAVQQVRAGLEAIYLSGWQVAADANLSGHMYPDQSLYPANSVPEVVRRINRALQRADQIESSEGEVTRYWMAPIIADAEAGFGGPLNAFELMESMIEAGAAAVHFEDQLASEKKCGHLGGKVLVPTSQFIRTLTAARLAADVMGVPTLLIARTDANGAKLITSDIDERDREFMTGERTHEGFYRIRAGLEVAIARGLAYAPYADMIWCETSKPDLEEARQFAEAIHREFPGKLLAYNCSPSFNWKKNLSPEEIASFQEELGRMGYKFQFVTLAGFHALNHSMYELAYGYRDQGMSAYSELQEKEFLSERKGYTASKHQREVGTSYFDLVSSIVSGGNSSTLAYLESTETEQFVRQ